MKAVTENYEPFGKEWELEMKKWNKDHLIQFLKKNLVRIQMAKNIIDAYDPEVGDPGGIIHDVNGILYGEY